MTVRGSNYGSFCLQMLMVLALAFLLLWSLPPEQILRAFPLVLFAVCIVWCETKPLERKKESKNDREFWSDLGVSMGVEIKATDRTAAKAKPSLSKDGQVAAASPQEAAAATANATAAATATVPSLRKVKELEWLADSAFRDGHYVEAYFWALKAHYNGSRTMTRTLAKYCAEWRRHGRPEEKDNVKENFSANSGSFTRSVLRIQCGIHPHKSMARIKELAAAGHRESIQYLHRHAHH